jgi:uncharacterized protein YecT (DUF1311 family)
MEKPALGLLILLAAPSCFCQDSPQSRACFDKAVTQAEITACASGEAARADAELNRVYQVLLTATKGNTSGTAKIKAAERAWIAYRDAHIEAMYPAADKQAEYGSIFPSEANDLYAKLTKRQIEALNDLVNQYSNKKE